MEQIVRIIMKRKKMNIQTHISMPSLGFADLLKYSRAKAQLTFDDFCQKIGVTRQTALKWEKNISFPKSEDILKKLSSTLRVPLQVFLELKDTRRIQSRQEKISDSKDPVISASWVNYVPLLNGAMKELPLSEITNPAKWTGKRFFLPRDLFSGYIFAFEITDRCMEPVYSAGDVILADLREPLKVGYPVVIKIKNHAPVCRIYTAEGSLVTLSPVDSKKPVLEAKKNEVQWCYGVIRHCGSSQ